MEPISDLAIIAATFAAILTVALVCLIFGDQFEADKQERIRKAIEAKRQRDYTCAAYYETSLPAYKREAKHPLDGKPYDIRKLN